jgi:hypothetical protein
VLLLPDCERIRPWWVAAHVGVITGGGARREPCTWRRQSSAYGRGSGAVTAEHRAGARVGTGRLPGGLGPFSRQAVL